MQGQHAAPGRGNADGRRTAHHHTAQSFGYFLRRTAENVVLRCRQQTLVQQAQCRNGGVKADMFFHTVLLA